MTYEPKKFGIVEKAPWSHDFVGKLNKYQQSCKDGPRHGYTCGRDHGKPVLLVASTKGWTCPEKDCDYTQDWAFGETLTI